MTKNISIIGSTGSIGTQALEVAQNLNLKVLGLTANSNIELLEKQARMFKPHLVAVKNNRLAKELAHRLKGTGVEVLGGTGGINRAASMDEADTVLNAIVGSAGLIPTLEAVRKGKKIALANKESLVTAGSLVMSEAKKHNAVIIPVDSEHSAIFQCIMGNEKEFVSKIILTASGGPFRGRSLKELEYVTPAEALKHPNWEMGSKITIDSATLMNKGLEVIEAKWLFGLELDRIEVVVHPQSLIHSMVEYVDGSVIAQAGPSDMRLPIQFALTYPKRSGNSFSRLDFVEAGVLTFERPDYEAFPCLRLAFDALKTGGTMPVVLNAANEAAVEFFIKGKIKFTDIPKIIKYVMRKHCVNINPDIDDIIEVDRWSRELARTAALSPLHQHK